MWNFSLEACQEQVEHEDFFGLEHPERASSWKLPQTQRLLRQPDVAAIVFDQCQMGLSVVPGELSQKPTRIATNNPWLALDVLRAQCDKSHSHRHLIGGLPALAQEYPPALCQSIAFSAQAVSLGLPCPSFIQDDMVDFQTSNFFGDDEEAEQESGEVTAVPENCPSLTEAQKRLVKRIHINTGHPPRDRLLRALRAAGALPQILKYVQQEFSCEDCQRRQRPEVHRKAQLPRTFTFNKVLCLDFFYLKWRDHNVAIFNMIDLGTSFQIAIRAPIAEGTSGGTPTSQTAWHLFVTTWLRYFGSPQMVVCDAGNEFRGSFERGLENSGILQHVIHPESPWENGLAERHGGWLKDRIDREIQSGRTLIHNFNDLDEMLSSLTSSKNNWLNRGGFTPSQLVFGQMVRLPGELLADDELALQGCLDAHEDPLQVDEAAGEFRRRFQIRERARQLALQQDAKEAIKQSSRAAVHQDRHWAPGQWVYVYRRARANQELHLRDRWVGPGVIVLVNNNTIYVGMRSRLWRCAAEQVRPALPSEILGRELASDPGLASLLHQVISGSQAGAVDVAREGPPPARAAVGPVERADEGVQIAAPPVNLPVPDMDESSRQAPLSAVPVPPGLQRELPSPVDLPTPLPARGPPAESNASDSRRPSTHEPASEPGILPRLEGSATDLSPISEISPGSASSVPEPPAKIPRTDDTEVGPPAATSSSSSTVPALPPGLDEGEAEITRAPGTPIVSLMRNVRRERSPRRPSGSQLTPGEDLTTPGRVQQQVEEFEGQHHLANFQTEDWSGSFFNYQRGDQNLQLSREGKWTFLAKRNDEVSLKSLAADERKMFTESDKVEWDAILKTGAVKVITGQEAERARRLHPDRILSSRMVRRKKPIGSDLGKWKAKSRWCLHGHTDPDTGSLCTYAPTPQSESMLLFLQTSVNHQLRTAFSDVKNAFCQSNRLKRESGPIYAEPCEGLDLPAGALILILIPVYGLDDAPAAWRRTVAEFLVEDVGCIRNIVEPCWFSKFCSKTGQLLAQILVEVDDFVVAAAPFYYETLKKHMESRFHFGKWEEDQAEYAGRRIRCTPEAIYVDQAKYILEQIHPISLPRGRRQNSKESLNDMEFNSLRSLVYRINWVARESRPEAAGLASILASKLKHARVEDIVLVNRFVNFLRTTAERPLKIWRYNPKHMAFIVCSDAGGINTKGSEMVDEEGLPTDSTQGAWIVLAAKKLPCGGQQIKASPIAWRSSKLKRKVFSTYGGETQAMLQGINEVDWLQVMYRDAVFNDVKLENWRCSLSPHMLVMRGQCELGGKQQQCSVTDAKSLYDCLLREHPTGKQDRKSALELAIVLRDLQETKSMVKWVPHQKMIVDCLTKEDPMRANDAFNHFIRTGLLSLVDVAHELEARKTDPAFRRRSNHASRERLLEEYQQNFVQWIESLVNYCWGGCEDKPLSYMISLDQSIPS